MHNHRAMPAFVVFSCVLLAGCGNDQATVWAARAKSPNGQLVASAQTTQYGGPGTAHVGTAVYLKQKKGSQPPLLILGFVNDSAYPTGATSLTIRWLSNSQLDVAYKPGSTIDFQAIKALGVAISAHQQASE